MPRFHDPAICTPERCRAVSALHWFGVLQLLFAVVCLFIVLLDYRARLIHPTGIPFEVSIYFSFLVMSFMIFAVPPTVAGIAAIAAAPAVCRRRQWGLGLGFAGTVVSLLWFFLGWCVFLIRLYFHLTQGRAHKALEPQDYPFALYLCVGTILALLVLIRLVRLQHSSNA